MYVSLLNCLHKSQRKRKNIDNRRLQESDFDFLNTDTVSYNFFRISKDLKYAVRDSKKSLKKDPITKLPLYKMDIGLKNFNFAATLVSTESLKSKTLENFAPNGNVCLMKFKRKNTEDMMSISEIREYIDIVDGKIFFLKKVDPKTIYKIVKSLNNEFYFIVNSLDNVIPITPMQAEAIFAKKKEFKLNSRLHVESVDNVRYTEDDLCSNFHSWFSKNVKYMHPYGYLDMVISEQVKCYKFTKEGSNNRSLTVKVQFSNELANKKISMNYVQNLRNFVQKCHNFYTAATNNCEEYIIALPFPLYKRHHMLSLVVAFKPDGEINATIINANGHKQAKELYAIPIGNILQTAFERYDPCIAGKINYFFHENNSQRGPTCMTHADYITKRVIKDKNSETDGHDVNPITILEKAYIRATAVTAYKEAVKQHMFIPDNVNRLENSGMEQSLDSSNYNHKDINNFINTSKLSKNFCENKYRYNDKNYYKDINNFINTSKLSKNFCENKYHYNDKNYF